MSAFGAVDEFIVIIAPGFIVIIDGRQVRIVKNVDSFVQPASCFQRQLSAFQMPAAMVNFLIFPLFGEVLILLIPSLTEMTPFFTYSLTVSS